MKVHRDSQATIGSDSCQPGFETSIHQRLQRMFALHRSLQDKAHPIDFYGLKLKLDPGVFSPAFGEGSRLLAECICTLGSASGAGQEPRVLDLGTGSGAIGLLALKHGVKHVVATDITAESLACARRNAENNSLQDRVTFRRGDLFEGIEPGERFDLILFNPPFMRSPGQYGLPATDKLMQLLSIAVFDDSLILERFIDGFNEHLAANGRVLLAYSNLAGLPLDLVLSVAERRRFNWRVLRQVAGRESQLKFYVVELLGKGGR